MSDFLPELSITTQAFLRIGYGTLLLVTLVHLLPNARWFFLSEKWGGYAKSSPAINAIQNPVVFTGIFALWLATAVLLITNQWTVAAAFLNAVFCYYFFIHQRWVSLLRGLGAPGFMTWWTGTAILFIEFTSKYSPEVRSLAVWVFQIDFAVIMFSAGFYKVTSGYLQNQGMELGVVNPIWGYWWRPYSKLAPNHWHFWGLNQAAWSTEVIASILMLFPSTRIYGAGLMVLAFSFILTHIRLGWLCEVVVVSCFLFVPALHPVDTWLAQWFWLQGTPVPVGSPAIVGSVLAFLLWGYVILRPIALLGLYYNFYRKRAFPKALQWALERYTNLFGIILWRVFTQEVVNFYVDIYKERPGGQRRKVSLYTSPFCWRYNHVGEAIAVTTLFTSLKYFSDQAVFKERVLRYSRTLGPAADETIVFCYTSVVRAGKSFEHRPAVEFRVAPGSRSVDIITLDSQGIEGIKVQSIAAQECVAPGSYVPLSR